jgi:hypothetical protein
MRERDSVASPVNASYANPGIAELQKGRQW